MLSVGIAYCLIDRFSRLKNNIAFTCGTMINIASVVFVYYRYAFVYIQYTSISYNTLYIYYVGSVMLYRTSGRSITRNKNKIKIIVFNVQPATSSGSHRILCISQYRVFGPPDHWHLSAERLRMYMFHNNRHRRIRSIR
jgi:hypothetical protein